MTLIIDTSDLDHLAVDLAAAGAAVAVKVVPALEHSAQNIEDQAREWAPKTRTPHYPATITHDVTPGVAGPVAEIGPDKNINGQAKLAHLFEYGSVNNAPFAHIGPAFDREVPDFVEAVGVAGGDVL